MIRLARMASIAFALAASISAFTSSLACAQSGPIAPSGQVIRFAPGASGGFPEGVAWDAVTRSFFVSSLRNGQIGQVFLDGSYRVFADDPSLVTTSGMLIDRDRNRVLVCNEDVGVGERSTAATKTRIVEVVEFDLATGRKRRSYDFSSLADGPRLANDLTIDPQGNIYVTDSFQPVIYKIDGRTGAPSILLRSDSLMPADVGEASGTRPYLNGIVYHPDGFLLVSDYSRGRLWKVALAEPGTFSEVRLAARLKGPDGLRLLDGGHMGVVQSYPGVQGVILGEVAFLSSKDGWESASITATATPPGLDGPTSATIRDGVMWVVNSRYPSLFADPARAANSIPDFTLQSVSPEP